LKTIPFSEYFKEGNILKPPDGFTPLLVEATKPSQLCLQTEN